ncbi:MAG TPA: vWA domain-containing protein [Polyangiaceae bacterium]|jgi:hypothetical protein|nr:vWA domain-containing protein [Polyangiaceae bacterium]
MPLTRRSWYWVGVSLSLAHAPLLGCSAGNGASFSGVRGSGGGSNGGDGDGAGNGAGPNLVVGSGGTSSISVDGGNGSAGSDNCAADSQQAMTLPVSIYVLLDQSGSMTIDGNRWAPVTAALKSFLAGPSLAGVGVGLQYFPLGATMTSDPAICVTANYSTPDVAVQDMPGNDAALAASIDKHFFTAAQGTDPAHWGTPTYPALEGSYAYLRQYLTSNPSRHGVLLLATDGAPSKICPNDTIAQITTLIAAQAAMTPPIQTYVVGIGKVANLDAWATAGGTGHTAFIVDGVGTTTQDDLAKALDEIRTFALPCDFAIPTPEAGTVDPSKVNVQFTPPGQAPTVFPKVDNAAACDATQPTWYYDDPAAPTRVVMCPTACNALHQDNAKIDILFGCTTEIFVPK